VTVPTQNVSSDGSVKLFPLLVLRWLDKHGDLPRAAHIIMNVLVRGVDNWTWRTSPLYPLNLYTLARRTKYARATVIHAVDKLIERGLVKRHKSRALRGLDGTIRCKVNAYEICLPPELVEEMRKKALYHRRETWTDYKSYLRSGRWRRTRAGALHKANFACEGCHERGGNLTVHHLSYARLGTEAAEDLAVLCVKCHNAVHDKDERGPDTRRSAPHLHRALPSP
jgi:5-methylcytosine-specific restriction endonuclease McrA